jgi:hypothetical protein
VHCLLQRTRWIRSIFFKYFIVCQNKVLLDESLPLTFENGLFFFHLLVFEAEHLNLLFHLLEAFVGARIHQLIQLGWLVCDQAHIIMLVLERRGV